MLLVSDHPQKQFLDLGQSVHFDLCDRDLLFDHIPSLGHGQLVFAVKLLIRNIHAATGNFERLTLCCEPFAGLRLARVTLGRRAREAMSVWGKRFRVRALYWFRRSMSSNDHRCVTAGHFHSHHCCHSFEDVDVYYSTSM